MFHMRMDNLMMGCTAAMLLGPITFKLRWAAPAALFLFVVSPYLVTRLHGYYCSRSGTASTT